MAPPPAKYKLPKFLKPGTRYEYSHLFLTWTRLLVYALNHAGNRRQASMIVQVIEIQEHCE